MVGSGHQAARKGKEVILASDRLNSHGRARNCLITWSFWALALGLFGFFGFLGGLLVSLQPASAAKLPIQLEAPHKKTPTEGLYTVKIEHGTRCTASGTMQAYTLYIPEGGKHLPQGPFPTAMLIHGFLMTGEQHRNNAMNLAEHGFIVMTPNISKWLW